jgi:hypothetical protein
LIICIVLLFAAVPTYRTPLSGVPLRAVSGDTAVRNARRGAGARGPAETGGKIKNGDANRI